MAGVIDTYIKSIIFAVIGVFFSLTLYILMGDMVKKLFLGERDFYAYLMEGLAMAALWIFRVVFHTLSTNISHRTTFKLISNVRILLIEVIAFIDTGDKSLRRLIANLDAGDESSSQGLIFFIAPA